MALLGIARPLASRPLLLSSRAACWRPSIPCRRRLLCRAQQASEAPEPSNQPPGRGKPGNQKLWDSKEARDLRSRVKRATAGEVVTTLQRGIASGCAGPKLLSAALYRLFDLEKRRRGGPAGQKACGLAMEEGLALVRSGQADAWLLVCMAQASYWLHFQLTVEQQQQITAALIRLLNQAGLEVQREDDLVARQKLSAEIFRGASNFVCSTFSNQRWCEQMAAEERAALRQLLQQHLDAGSSQGYTNVLTALLRLKVFIGDAVVTPFLDDGTVERIVGKLLAGVDGLNAQDCKDTILSLGVLCAPIEPDQLSALLRQLSLAINSDSQPVNRIANTFAGLSRLYRAFPGRYEAVLELPAVQELCERFVQLVDLPRQNEEWATMVLPCGTMRLNPAVGPGGQLLFDVLVSQLPALKVKVSPFESTDILRGLGAFYGVPVDDKLAPALQPHHQLLASMAARAESKLELYIEKRLPTDPAALVESEVREVIRAFATLR